MSHLTQTEAGFFMMQLPEAPVLLKINSNNHCLHKQDSDLGGNNLWSVVGALCRVSRHVFISPSGKLPDTPTGSCLLEKPLHFPVCLFHKPESPSRTGIFVCLTGCCTLPPTHEHWTMAVPASPFPPHATPSGLLSSPQSSSFELPEGSLPTFTSSNQLLSQCVSTLSAKHVPQLSISFCQPPKDPLHIHCSDADWAACEAHKKPALAPAGTSTGGAQVLSRVTQAQKGDSEHGVLLSGSCVFFLTL